MSPQVGGIILLSSFLFLGVRPVLCVGASQSQGNRAASREGLADWLRHQEGLVRTAEVEYEVLFHPTAPEMIPLIKRLVQIRQEKIIDRYIYTEKDSKRWNAQIHWWRKGAMERAETIHPSQGDELAGQKTIEAFDGQVLRRLFPAADGVKGEINTGAGGNWTNSNRPQPFSFLYEFLGIPYSEIISKGPNFAMSQVSDPGGKRIHIAVGHPQFADTSFELDFDEKLLPLDRKTISDVGNKVVEWLSFSDYRSHPDASGETILFPHQVIRRACAGILPDGRLVITHTQSYTIKTITFNAPIPDDLFVIDFPPDTEINDRISGMRSASDFSFNPIKEIQNPSRRWAYVTISALVLILGAVFMLRRKLKGRVAPSRR